jgi:type VI secretion system protein ImpJ
LSNGAADTSRVVWSEGIFLRPHHFQQQDRWVETSIHGATRDLVAGAWGVRRVQLDEGLLQQGRVGLAEADVVLPDGTAVRVGRDTPPPEPITIGDEGGLVFLAVPQRLAGAAAVDAGGTATGLRLRGEMLDVKDEIASPTAATERLEVAVPALVLLRESDPHDGYAALAVARIKTVETPTADDAARRLALDDDFILPTLRIDGCPVLKRRVRDLLDQLAGTAEDLVAWVRGKRAGVGSEQDLWLLQVINRAELELRHLHRLGQIHPERLYLFLVGLLGELATLTSDGRRPPPPEEIPPYRHDLPGEAFTYLFRALGRQLGTKVERRAVKLEVQKMRHRGTFVVQIDDHAVVADATLYLAVGAATPVEEIYQGFPKAATIGPINDFQGLIDGQMRGIGAEPVRHLPDGLPYYQGRAYFALDRTSPYWANLPRSPGMGVLVIGPLADADLVIDCWAIKD